MRQPFPILARRVSSIRLVVGSAYATIIVIRNRLCYQRVGYLHDGMTLIFIFLLFFESCPRLRVVSGTFRVLEQAPTGTRGGLRRCGHGLRTFAILLSRKVKPLQDRNHFRQSATTRRSSELFLFEEIPFCCEWPGRMVGNRIQFRPISSPRRFPQSTKNLLINQIATGELPEDPYSYITFFWYQTCHAA
jgi:hypothetical protein